MTKIISYSELNRNEGTGRIQRGMNFNINPAYAVVLMSVKRNAPYDDGILPDGTIKYEGHDIRSSDVDLKKNKDQPLETDSGALTENGKFFEAAQKFKSKESEAKKVRIYQKLEPGIWVDRGFYYLMNAYPEFDGKRKVYKFLLVPMPENSNPNLT